MRIFCVRSRCPTIKAISVGISHARAARVCDRQTPKGQPRSPTAAGKREETTGGCFLHSAHPRVSAVPASQQPAAS